MNQQRNERQSSAANTILEITGSVRLLVVTTLFLLVMMISSPNSVHAQSSEAASLSVYRTANFQINYRDAATPGVCPAEYGDFGTWSNDAKAAMNHTIDLLDDLLNSAVPIVIDACFQNIDASGGFLAFAGPTANYTKAMVPSLPVANRAYPVALTNTISGSDQNGSTSELFAVANSASPWDFCTTGCMVANNRMDFVSTMLHELLHGLGFAPSFDADPDNPTLGSYGEPPAVIDDYVIQVSDSSRLLDLPNHSTELMNAMQQGSGTIAFAGPKTMAINNGNTPFFYTPSSFEQGSSMSHWDDDHPSNIGRLMTASTFSGPSTRVVDAVTLMVLKDIGWHVNDAADYNDSTLSAYGVAQHINGASFFGAMILGSSFSSEGAPAADDVSDDGVTRSPTWVVGASGGQITVTVGSSQSGVQGCLSGWIDWSADGDFADAGEQIAAMAARTNGSQQIMLNVPATAQNSTFYNARFRLVPDWDGDGICSDQVALTPAGGVLGGEVEDYQWQLDEAIAKEPPAAEQVFLPLVSK